MAITNVFAKCGSIRRKIARAVDGCWYSLLNVVPGSCSRYSKERVDIVEEVERDLLASGCIIL